LSAQSQPSFKVPLGLAPNGAVVHARDADKGTPYVCPACSTPLVLRAGEIRRRHFAHRADTGCSPETALHDGTKRRLAAAVTDWRAGIGPQPVVRRQCPWCDAAVDTPLSDHVSSAQIEYRTSVGRVFDVGLLDADAGIHMGLEVLVSHRVDEAKAIALGDLAWIEIEAASVIEPAVWPALRVVGHVSSVDCPACAERRAGRREQTIAIAAAYGLPDPGPDYLAVERSCWKCGLKSPVFFWPGIGDRREPPAPSPRTVMVRYSNTIQDSYPSNGCIHCGALVGEWFLPETLFENYDEPDAIELNELYFPDPTPGPVRALRN
jgi:predicted RNA-binding Zn-ribbon protein involved in translation (DUF1610 family)